MNDSDTSALQRAVNAGTRAARVGFDWDEPGQALDKVAEEVDELREALRSESPARIADELGDLYFAVTNVARKLGLDPEATLHDATEKFEQRFQLVVAAAQEQGRELHDLTLEELEALWVVAKSRSASGGAP